MKADIVEILQGLGVDTAPEEGTVDRIMLDHVVHVVTHVDKGKRVVVDGDVARRLAVTWMAKSVCIASEVWDDGLIGYGQQMQYDEVVYVGRPEFALVRSELAYDTEVCLGARSISCTNINLGQDTKMGIWTASFEVAMEDLVITDERPPW